MSAVTRRTNPGAGLRPIPQQLPVQRKFSAQISLAIKCQVPGNADQRLVDLKLHGNTLRLHQQVANGCRNQFLKNRQAQAFVGEAFVSLVPGGPDVGVELIKPAGFNHLLGDLAQFVTVGQAGAQDTIMPAQQQIQRASIG